MDNDGNLLPAGDTIGEIVIRGEQRHRRGTRTIEKANKPKVSPTAGSARVTKAALDSPEGYLSLTGRLKEIINRGGEKISPREVDEVLMDHPAVAQVVTFAHSAPQAG
jgi:acyl-CoA synthetase (AMP-forming)/AMP-acid ligase II